eukprot:518882_1
MSLIVILSSDTEINTGHLNAKSLKRYYKPSLAHQLEIQRKQFNSTFTSDNSENCRAYQSITNGSSNTKRVLDSKMSDSPTPIIIHGGQVHFTFNNNAHGSSLNGISPSNLHSQFLNANRSSTNSNNMPNHNELQTTCDEDILNSMAVPSLEPIVMAEPNQRPLEPMIMPEPNQTPTPSDNDDDETDYSPPKKKKKKIQLL